MTYPTPSGRHSAAYDGWRGVRPGDDQQRYGGYPPQPGHPGDAHGSWWDQPAAARPDAAAGIGPHRGRLRPPPADTAGPAPGLRTTHGEPAPAEDESEQQREKEEERWANLRRQVAHTLQYTNRKHLHEAFDRFNRSDAFSPHGVVLFYAVDDRTQEAGYKLHPVVRLNYTGPEFDNLHVFLHGLANTAVKFIAESHRHGQRWDPRGPERALVNTGNMDMPRSARFVGTGVTSLDTEQGDWFTVAQTVHDHPGSTSVFDIPGQCLALLTDDTAISVLRDPHRRLATGDGVKSSKPLDAKRAHFYNPHADLTQQGDHGLVETWRLLTVLHHRLQDYLVGGRTAS